MFETIIFEDVPLVEFMYLVFTHARWEILYIFQALINSLVCWLRLSHHEQGKTVGTSFYYYLYHGNKVTEF